MGARWTAEQLSALGASTELEIAVQRDDGTLRAWTPIWVVCAGDDVFVRSWHRRDTGWFGHAVTARRARVRVAGLEADVVIDDVGGASDGLTSSIDAAYRPKYGDGGAGSMVTPAAAATTLRLDPA